MLNSIFNSNKTFIANIQSMSNTVSLGQVSKDWITTHSVKCVFWRGNISTKLLSEKFRADVSGVVLLRPSDINSTDIKQSGRIQIMDSSTQIGIFKIVYADDIANQGKVIIVPVKEFT